MATQIDVSGLTLSKLEVQNINDFIKKYYYENPGIMSYFGQINKVTMQQDIGFINQNRLSGIADTTCDRPASMQPFTTSSKTWNPKKIGDTMFHCQADLNALFKPYYLNIDNFKQLYDIQGSDIEMVLVQLITNLADRSVFRHAFLGNTTLAAAGAATAGLRSGTGAALGHYNVIDGIWKQIFTYIATAPSQRITITENTSNTLAGQKTFASGAALAYLDQMYNSSPIAMRTTSPSDQMITVTDAFWLNYRASMRNADAAIVGSGTYEKAPLPTLTYNGIPVVNIGHPVGTDLETDLQKNTGTGAAAADLPNRVLWTTKNNVQLATLNADDFAAVETNYNVETRKLMLAFGYTLDAKVIDDSMYMVAY